MTKNLSLAVLLIVVLLGGCASDGGGDVSDGSIEVTVDGDQVTGDTEATVPAGTEVTVEVSSDTDDRIHVHGYDLYGEISDGSGAVEFTADIPGVFEIEMEETGTLLVELTVE